MTAASKTNFDGVATADQWAASAKASIFRSMPGYPWLNPCPRCGYSESCDCTVLERAVAAHPGLVLPTPPTEI